MKLYEKLEYVKSAQYKEKCREWFSETEWELLCAVWEFQAFKKKFQESANGTYVEKYLYKLDCEKPYHLRIKELMEEQTDDLLSKQCVDGWFDLLVWRKLIIPEELVNRFWDLDVLDIILNIFVAECEECGRTGAYISVLQFRHRKELMETYYKALFLLRRIEFDMEPAEAIIEAIKDMNLSSIYIRSILQKGQIFAKGKVEKLLVEGGVI